MSMRRWSSMCLSVGMLACSLVIPTVTWAQTGGIAGAIRDTSGAVIPGVTVEASSPALIERTRTAVTDSEGQYKILDLRPGVFVVTFSLQGFKTIKREGVEVTAGSTVNLTAQLEIGSIEETITVSGQVPLVDVQNATQHSVITQEVITALPTGKTSMGLAALIPGMKMQTALGAGAPGRDVGGNQGDFNLSVVMPGTRFSDSQDTIEGMSYNNLLNSGGGGQNSWAPNSGLLEQVQIDVTGSVEAVTGAPRVNAILRDGGNTFHGQIFANFTNKDLQTSNITPALQARGVASLQSTDRVGEFNPVVSGPLLRQRLWFVASYKWNEVRANIPGAYFSKDPSSPVFSRDLTRPVTTSSIYHWEDIRLTWQATPKNKVTLYQNFQQPWLRNYVTSATTAPEAGVDLHFTPGRLTQVTETSTITNKLLFEGGLTILPTGWDFFHPASVSGITSATIPTTDLGTGITYRANQTTALAPQRYTVFSSRSKLSYVTGSHALQVGVNYLGGPGQQIQGTNDCACSIQVRNQPDGTVIPVQVTLFAAPWEAHQKMLYQLSPFVQEQWTRNRLTLTGGLRFDFVHVTIPAQDARATFYTPAVHFEAIDNVPAWKDIEPRFGAAWDVFGDGKTAVKGSMGRYVQSVALGLAQAVNPISNGRPLSTTRSWTSNPSGTMDPTLDCNLRNPAANGTCGPILNPAFGTSNITTTFDPDYLNGWQKRNYNWAAQVSVQRQLTAGVSATAGYTRRWYGNFLTLVNPALAPSNYSPFSVTAPVDSRLPNGGGNAICCFYDLEQAYLKFVRQTVTLANNYGNISDVYTGFDFNLNARLPHGVIVQGGVHTGHEVIDVCDVAGKVNDIPMVNGGAYGLPPGGPNLGNTGNLSLVPSPSTLYCHMNPPFLTDAKVLGVFPLPWWGLRTSVTFQSSPGPNVLATYNAPNALVQPSLGRPLSGGKSVIAVNLLEPGSVWGDRVQQLDLRGSKIFKVGRTNIVANVDLYNVLNNSAVLRENLTYGPAWRNPLAVMPGRFVKFGTEITF